MCDLPQEPWSEEERRRFLVDRLQVLHKLLTDRQTWRRTSALQDGAGPLHMPWTDRAGQAHDQPLTAAFLSGHARILRGVTFDLIDCGGDGQRLAEQMFATLSADDRLPDG